MADDCDRADQRITDAVADGIAECRRAPSLTPIIQVLDGIRFGVCHYCETEIRPGHLFCPTDAIDPDESCAVLWEHMRRRKEDMGL